MMKRPNASVFALIPLALIFIGCGPSKEEQAVNRALNRKKPGYARVVNFTDKPATLRVDGKDSLIAGPATVSSSMPIGPASRTFGVSIDKQEVEAGKADLATDQIISIYAFNDASKPATFLASTEKRDPAGATPSLQVTVVGKGSPVTVLAGTTSLAKSVVSGTTSEASDLAESVKELVIQDDAGKTIGKVPVTVEPKIAYTLAVYLNGGKVSTQFLRNTPIRKPGGTSGFTAGG